MPLTPLIIPPGLYANGTETQAAGRWARASRVRWREGAIMPIGGWSLRTDAPINHPRAMLAWQDLSGNRRIVMGGYDKLIALAASGAATDITPTGLAAGDIDATYEFAYGAGPYGTGAFGVTRPAPGAFSEASVWSVDLFGQFPVACMASDGRAVWWDLNNANRAVAIPGAPIDNTAVIVTGEEFLMLLGAGGDPRKVQWADKQSLTTWTPSATNEAGDQRIKSDGQLMLGLRVRGQTLLLTDVDAHVATYVGPPFVYSINGVTGSCSAVSRRCAAEMSGAGYWMGVGGFYRYNGGDVEDIPCDVRDKVFLDFNEGQQSKVWAVTNAQHGEVWWFYPSGSSVECDSYVAYSVTEKHWATGRLSRLCGVDRSVFRAPLWADADGKVYNHETGLAMDGELPWLESAPLTLGSGDNVMMVRGAISDERTEGDATIRFRTRNHPNKPERSYGPYALSNPTDFRFTGRHVIARIESERLANWRVGVFKLDMVPGGER